MIIFRFLKNCNYLFISVVNEDHRYSCLSKREPPQLVDQFSQTEITMADMCSFKQRYNTLKEKISKPDKIMRDSFISKITKSDRSVQKYTGVTSKALLDGMFGMINSLSIFSLPLL